MRTFAIDRIETACANALNVCYYIKHLLKEQIEIAHTDGNIDEKDLNTFMSERNAE